MRVTRRPFPLIPGVLGAIALAALAGLAARAIHYASLPPFEPASSLAAGPRVDFERVAFTRDTPRGRLEVQVGRIRPGHQRIGYFVLGPSTHLVLEHVSVRLRSGTSSPWIARGKRARLQGEAVRFSSRCTWFEPPQPPRLRSDVRIDLRTGAVSAPK